MRAIILAGGKGTRLLPYTSLIPKPLVPIGDKFSILEIIIFQLVQHGFTHITLTVNHLSHLIESYFGDGKRFGIKIDYSLEEKPLSTIGPLTLLNDLPENFLVMNGDILTNLDYSNFFWTHCNNHHEISVSAMQREVPLDFGILEYDNENQLTKFQEKPTYYYNVSMGVYCINKKIVEELAVGEPYGFDNLMLDSLKNGRKVSIVPFNGFWLDIGRPDDYKKANENYEALYEMLGVVNAYAK